MLVAVLLSLPVFAQEYDPEAALDQLVESAPQGVTEQWDPRDSNTDRISSLLSPDKWLDLLSGQLWSGLQSNLKLFLSFSVLLVLIRVFDVLKSPFAAKGMDRLGDFLCAAAIALLICPPMMEHIAEISRSIEEITGYMEVSTPILAGLMAAGGQAGSAAVFHFFLYLAGVFSSKVFSQLLLPLCTLYLSVGVAAAVTDNEGLKSLTGAVKSVAAKGVTVLCTIYAVLLSLQGVIAGAGDTISRRAMKLAVGSFLPVTGSLMSESVDTFLSGVGVIRSVAGALGILVVLYLIVFPVLRVAANYLLARACVFFGDFLGIPRIRSLLAAVADGYALLLSLAAGVGMMFITGLAFLLIAGGAA